MREKENIINTKGRFSSHFYCHHFLVEKWNLVHQNKEYTFRFSFFHCTAITKISYKTIPKANSNFHWYSADFIVTSSAIASGFLSVLVNVRLNDKILSI